MFQERPIVLVDSWGNFIVTLIVSFYGRNRWVKGDVKKGKVGGLI